MQPIFYISLKPALNEMFEIFSDSILQFQLRMFARLLNGVTTILISVFIYRIYQKNRKRFYLLWSIGFLSYGLNIVIRAIIDSNPVLKPTMSQWLTFLLFMTGSVFIMTGIGDLIDKTRTALISALLLPAVPLIAYNMANPEVLGWIAALTPYFLISLSQFFIRRKYGAAVDLFVVGWFFLLFVNVAWSLNMMNPIFVDLSAIFGKTIIFYGMIRPQFTYLVDDMKRFLISGVPEAYPGRIEEHYTLVNLQSREKDKEIDWIINKTAENTRRGIRTILVTLYDLLTPSDLVANGLDRESLYIIRMLPGVDHSIQSFEDNMATMNDDLNQLNLLITEIINFSDERKIRCDIILYTLSWVIHTHGWRKVYHLLASKSADLKTSNVKMYHIYFPETHQMEEITKFEKMADRLIKI